MSFSLFFQWSLRDLRQRWLQVVAVAMVIALGTGADAGLGSNTPWRTHSYDKSYSMLNMYDLKMQITRGSTLEARELAQVVDAVEGVQAREMRLVLPTFVDASTPERTILVSGRIVGVDVSSGGPVVNGIHIAAGRALGADDDGEPVCIVERNFADYYDLEPGDREIRIRGGQTLIPLGVGASPEYFMVVTEEGGMMAEADFAALFVPLQTVQKAVALPGMVNEVVLTVTDDADLSSVKQALRVAMAAAFPKVGVNFEEKSENEVHKFLYEDISGDQAMFNIFAFLLLAGATFGTFTLVSRMVESGRREIGIHMALGVKPSTIALRYLFAGIQIALLGAIFGLIIGAILSRALGNLIRGMYPLPYLETPFQPFIFLRSALLGVAVPLLAAVYPIWRAVKVAPIEAIQVGHLVARGGGLAPWLTRSPLGGIPGTTVAKFPFRNLSRNPRRVLLTVFGITMAVIILVATVGMLDSFLATLDAGRKEHLKGVPDRILVTLDSFYPAVMLPDLFKDTVSPGPALISQIEPIITLPGSVSNELSVAAEGKAFDVVVQLMDLDNNLWTPTILRGEKHAARPGAVISEKAARDLGVDIGDTVVLEHPYRESLSAYRLEKSEVQVAGIHADVLRFYLYMDIEDAAIMNLDGLVNGLQIEPAAGVEEETIRKALSHVQGVASIRSISALVDTYSDLVDLFVRVLGIVQYIALALAFLIAFNTTNINVDERRRELATMFAFGTRIRTTIRMAVTENLTMGIVSTVVGVWLGWVVLHRLLSARMETMMPDIGIVIQVAPSTLVLAACFGVLVVALTPMFSIRRLTRMDIPSTLRVVE
jgi:putative ABC transport system permease protein